ncbi:MAG: aminotransferase class I/II-fold pyridoxal phosphate-dependent enzyme, partial [Elusimicrobia bacterium]|nr:aminotransferase class I/II-fold pyridoxal phosphate-dependent enzyme [Elusimicrobiota bacterium]
EDIHYYPQPAPADLKERIGEIYGIDPSGVILGNGTDELIELITRVFLYPGRSLLISENSFVRYKMGGLLAGAEIIEVPQDNFKIDLKQIAEEVREDTALIFIDNPCNPTGRYLAYSEIEEFLNRLKEREMNPLIVFDEAYAEYAVARDYKSCASLVAENPAVAVLRTFSKIYGLAGLRMGYGLTSPIVADLINRICPPFNTSRPAQAAALAALEDDSFIKQVSEETYIEKKFLYGELDKLDIDYVPSEANFILFRPERDVDEFSLDMLKAGVIVRPPAGYSLPGYIRVTVGQRAHNLIFIKALRKIQENNSESD